MITSDSALRNRYFLDRHDFLAGATVQHVDAALLGRCQYRRLDAVSGFHVQQGRLTTDVHVPQVMVSELVVPAHAAGSDVQCNQARAVLLGLWRTVAAPLVRGLVTHRQVDHAELFIDAEHGPHVRRVARVDLAFGNRRSFFRIAAVPVPHQTAGVHVIGTDHAGRLVYGDVVSDVATDNHQVLGDRGWRRGVVAARSEGAHVGGQVDRTLVAEVFTHLASIGVQRDQTGVGSRQEDSARAGSTGSGRAVSSRDRQALRRGAGGIGSVVMIGDATAGHVRPTLEVGSVLSAELRIKAPDFLARIRVERDHLTVRRAHVEHAVDLERGVLGSGFTRVIRPRNVTGAIGPGRLQLVDVFRCDLRQWRVAVTEGGAAVGLPVAVRHGRGGVGRASRLAVQLAFDTTRIGELAGQRGQAGQHHSDAQCTGAHACRTVAQQRLAEPWQQQHDTQGEPQRQAWHQLPPVEADFPQRPHGAREQQQCIKAQRSRTTRDQQHASHGEADTGQQVIQRAIQLQQSGTTDQQGQPHQQDHQPEQGR